MEDDLGKVLIIGACGQIGSELTETLQTRYGKERVLAADKVENPDREIFKNGNYKTLDVLNKETFRKTLEENQINTVFNLAAVLSAKGEKKPQLAFRVNTIGVFNTLELGRKLETVQRIIIPSSIAVFGPEAPKIDTPDQVYLRPRSMYGVTKVTGELLGYYYWHKYGLDVRELRLPGIISYKTPPGGGTTDYAVTAFYKALIEGHYDFFVEESTKLPMMYMPDCIKSLISLAKVKGSSLKGRTNYNVSSMDFTAGELASAIHKYIPEFTYDFKPDYRQNLANSWPDSIDDSAARSEWGWEPDYDMEAMVADMVENISFRLENS